jgi:hypothetical protein
MINNYQDALLKHQGQYANPGLAKNLWNVWSIQLKLNL